VSKRKKSSEHLHGATTGAALPALGFYMRESIEVTGLLNDVLLRLEKLPTENQLAVLDQLLQDMRSWQAPATIVVKALRQWIRDDYEEPSPRRTVIREEVASDDSALPWDRARADLAAGLGVRADGGKQPDQ